MNRFLKKKQQTTQKCHPERSEGSFTRFFGRCPQNDVATQCGRSMVEMLGVLAVMGVLSVGGVAMYTSAMNKHNANELLNEASKRATIVAVQIAAGLPLSLSEFQNEKNSTIFETNVYNADGDELWQPLSQQFTLSIQNVNQSICQNIKNSIGTQSPIRSFEPGTCRDNNTIKLTYNNDLSRADIAPKIACGEENPCVNGCQECKKGICQNKCSSDQVCRANDVAGTKYICQNIGCDSCDANQYCEIKAATCNGTNLRMGSCISVDKSIFNSGVKTITFSDGTKLKVYKSTASMSWWTAHNYCEAKHKQLISLADLKCDTTDCSEWSSLKSALGNDYYWTRDSMNSCRAYRLQMKEDTVSDDAIDHNRFALCR